MGINGIGAGYYPATGYTTKKSGKNAASGTTGFTEATAEIRDRTKIDYDEKAFESVGANAPEQVKQAWMEAAKEAGVNGFGMSGNGMLTHISQMMVKRAEKWMKGLGESNDILGNTVQSAIRVTEQALYDLDHPLSPSGQKSIEVQGWIMKERAFYQSFLNKLNALV